MDIEPRYIGHLAALQPGEVALHEPRRADRGRLQRDIEAANDSPTIEALLAATNTSLLVLNEQRQIVAFNGRGLGSQPASELLGLRLGDALRCVHAPEGGGCGMAPACAGCGALGAMLECQRRGQPLDSECVLQSEGEAALEFDVRATPMKLGSGRFTVVSLRDISGERRRQALERVFFHDVLNTVTGLRGWAELLRRAQGSYPGAPERLERLSRQIEREIRDHRALVLAEDGVLVPRPERISAAELLREVEDVFASNVVARSRKLEREAPPDLELETDPALLQRVLVNMVQNAFEATEPGGTVRLRCEHLAATGPASEGLGSGGRIRFSVHNQGAMPREVQLRVFRRSFSTKRQPGRGLGTYSMKLLGESYLAGEVSFRSSAEHGTTFQIDLPPVLKRLSLSDC